MKIIVTAGRRGADIDVFGCIIAYAELLQLEGCESIPVVEGNFTSSVTPSLVALGAQFEKTYTPDGTEKYVLVDISDPEHFASFVDHQRISEVYDHRSGHEGFWTEKLGADAHIEMVGACGTLIWEEFKKRGKEKEITHHSAMLLLATIVSNNLAFKSPLVTERDKHAYSELKKIVNISDDWIDEYFSEQEQILLEEFDTYFPSDVKKFTAASGEFVIGQIEMWNASRILDKKKDKVDSVMATYEPTPWFVNILSISEGIGYIYSTHEQAKEIASQKLGFVFDGDVAKSDELIMRKRLMKKMRE